MRRIKVQAKTKKSWENRRQKKRERPGFPKIRDLLKRFAFQIAPLQIFCLVHALQLLLI